MQSKQTIQISAIEKQYNLKIIEQLAQSKTHIDDLKTLHSKQINDILKNSNSALE